MSQPQPDRFYGTALLLWLCTDLLLRQPEQFLVTDLVNLMMEVDKCQLQGYEKTKLVARVRQAMKVITASGHLMKDGTSVSYKRNVVMHPEYPEQRAIAQYTRIPKKP